MSLNQNFLTRIKSACRVAVTLLIGFTATPLVTQAASDVLPPELNAPEIQSDFGIVSTGCPEATRAAVDVLERGGNAIDAAVTAALVLGVADSDASGIGGATYMVIRLAGGRAVAIDGTPPTPGRIDIESFREVKRTGQKYGYEMVAVPTTLAVLDLAIRSYGTISMAEALHPAIEVAENGYRLSPIQIFWTLRNIEHLIGASSYLPFLIMEDGHTVGEPGDLFCNHDLANTLREIARDGVHSFYRGAIADRIDADMARKGGYLRKSDLAMLRVRETLPVQTTYRGLRVLTVPSPGGGETLIGALNILETFPSDFMAENSTTRHQYFIESLRMARADRASTGAGMVASSTRGVGHLTKQHARDRARMITPGSALAKTSFEGPIDPDCLPDGESTTQISIIDARGNAVSVTQSLGRSFGARIATPGLGFPYNSFLEFFKVDKPNCPGFLHPYSLCGTDMAPTILVNGEQIVTVLGTPGSNRIPSILAGIISNLVDRHMDLRDAVDAPRIVWGGVESITIEAEIAEPITDVLLDALDEIGYEHPSLRVHVSSELGSAVNFGGVNAVAYDPATGRYSGITDPRRGGLAQGPRVVAVHD